MERSLIKEVAEVMDVPVISLKRAEGTRWISHRLQAMEAFRRNYPCLITHWEDVASAQRQDVRDVDKAVIKGWLAKMQSVKFLEFFHFYMDVLAHLSAISVAFQAEKLSLQEVRDTITVHVQSLRSLQDQKGEASGVMVNKLRDAVDTGEDGVCTFEGIALKGTLDNAMMPSSWNKHTGLRIARTSGCG